MELAACAMDGILDEIMLSVPDSRLLSTSNGLPSSLRDQIQSDLVQYKETVSAKYFSRIWQEKRKDSDSGSELSLQPSPQSAPPGHTFNLGSAKKMKYRKKHLDTLDEEDDDDEYDEGARNGIVRNTVFGSQVDRHFFAKSSVKASVEEMTKKKRKPLWKKKFHVFVKSILRTRAVRSTPKLMGNVLTGPFANMGFICLPNGLRSHVTDTSVPEWNTWDDSIPQNFFMFMDKFVCDTGFLVVLHSEEYDHTRKRIIEYLTRPSDVVLDWSVGEGSSYYVGDLCGRHVVGLEDRPIFDVTAENAMHSTSIACVPISEQPQLRIDSGAGPSGSKDPEKKKLFDFFNFSSDDDKKTQQGDDKQQQDEEQ
ncbi:unnamed protein product [Calypogeia fissa]